MSYYMLFTRDADGEWAPQFGDYYRDVVAEEMRDAEYAKADRKIIRLASARQVYVNAALRLLNRGLMP